MMKCSVAQFSLVATRLSLVAALCLFVSGFVSADEGAPGNSELVINESFDGDTLVKGWKATTGKWTVADGVLRASEIKSEKHSAAARRVVETQNAVYEMRFRFVDDGKFFHFGFDPKRGSLEKKGHLFSVIVSPTNWKIIKHIDKAKPKEDPNEVLAKADSEVQEDKWYTLRVTTWGTHVTAKIEGKDDLRCSHPTFVVPKPTLVFRAIGDGVEIDDVKVWKQK